MRAHEALQLLQLRKYAANTVSPEAMALIAEKGRVRALEQARMMERIKGLPGGAEFLARIAAHNAKQTLKGDATKLAAMRTDLLRKQIYNLLSNGDYR